MLPTSPTAATITVRQALDLLDGNFAALANGVAQRRYVFWLGSGISRDRVDDLKKVIHRVLDFLQKKINQGDANCRYRLALKEALGHAQLSPAEESGIDFAQTIDKWAGLDTILNRLAGAYASLLDVRVDGEEEDYLLWNAVDVVKTFATSSVAPDCEHLCIAILIIEGVIPDIASANWDGLIESAVNELTDASRAALRVCVTADNLREPPLFTRLLKFHGCAVRAGVDPTTYRHLLIARHSQITQWRFNHDYSVMRHQLVDLAVTKPTLMIGLSGQDTNIQDVFAEGEAMMSWNWPSTPPAHIFAEEAIGPAQRNLLKCVYRTDYNANSAAIESGAQFRAYGKPLLTALVLHILCTKLRAFAQAANASALSTDDRTEFEQGIISLRNRLAIAAEPDRLAFIQAFVKSAARNIALFREGILPPVGSSAYHALSTTPVHMISGDSTLQTSGIRELACALGLLGLGEMNALWTIEPGDIAQPTDGSIRVSSSVGVSRVFFAATSRAAVQLEINAIVAADDSDVVIIHSTTPVRRMPRSPSASPGRTGKSGLRNVSMADLLCEALNVGYLQNRFREESAL